MEAGMSGEQDGRRDMVTSWAEESVWSFVCLTELGLISKPCRKSKSCDALADDGSLVRTSTPTPKEFPSINSTIDAAGTHRSDLVSPTKILPQSRKKPSLRRLSNGKGRTRKKTKKLASTTTAPCKSTTAERNVCWELDPERDHARNTTVEQFWKSCKRKVNGDPRKRPDENCHDPDRSLGTAANDHFPTSDQPRSVDLVPGICYQAERPGDSDGDGDTDVNVNVNETTVPGSNGPQQTLNPAVGHQLHRRKPAKLASRRNCRRRRRRRKTKLEIPDTDVINVETSPTSIFNHESAGSSQNIREEEEDSQQDDQEEHWEHEDETVDSPPLENDLQDSISNSQVPEASSTLFESGIGTSEADFDKPQSCPDQEQELKPEPTGLPEDIDAEGIPATGNKCPTTDDEENCYGSRDNCVQTFGSSGFSDSYSVVEQR
ncbi:uncharacterized protein LOC143353005 [Halictus rubicundus]|uniref:uncharacterized protein LOC143353005 n=1 Tax=Halictus rubicundus TaxID=77578 RepID=UPI0040364335